MKGVVIVCILPLIFVAQAGKTPKEDSPELESLDEDNTKPKTDEEDSLKPQTLDEDSPEPKKLKKDNPEPKRRKKDSPKPKTVEKDGPEPKTLEKDGPEPKTLEKDSPEAKTLEEDSPEPKTVKDSVEPEASQRDLVAVPRNLMEWTPRSLINPEELGFHFEGDIVLPPGGLGRSGRLPESYRWPNGTVPFEILDGEFTEEEVNILFVAMEEYYNKTNGCIKFQERENENDFVAFMSGDSECSSLVGKQGGMQPLRLSPRCFQRYGTILHEMLHALGFFHEQSRTDRDSHVTIKWENVDQSHIGNFKKYSSAEVSPFGISYDYGSIMHYSAYAFTMNGDMTIVPMDPSAVTGQRKAFSAKDLQKLKNMYKCGQRN